MTKDNQNQIQQREHDTSLGMKKIALYGWDGSNAVMIQVDANGVIQTSGGGTPTLAQVLAAGNATGGNSIVISNSTDEITSATNASINIVPNGSGEIFLGTNAGNIDLSTASGSINLYTSNNSGIDLSPHGTGRVTIGGSAAGVNTIIDDDTMATATSSSLSTSESIKAYVDAQSGGGGTLAQTLALGNTTGGNDIVVSSGDVIKSPSASTLTLESGATGEGTPPGTTTQSIPDISDANIVSYYKMDDNGIFPEDTTDANLVAWYKFEDGSGSTVTDAQGNYNATLSGAYVWNGSGAFNASTDSVNFSEGSPNAQVNAGNITELAGTDQATFSFWFKYDTIDNGVIVSKYSSSANNFYIQPAHNDGNTYVYISTAGQQGGRTWNYGGVFTAGNWYYMTVVYDGTQATNADRVKIYYNDVNVGTAGTSGGTGFPTTLSATTTDWLIGNYGAGTTNGWNGDIDNFAIYDRALTYEEHLRNYRKMQTTYIADYVGTNHGAIAGNPTWVTGYFGYSGDEQLDFDGTGDQVNLGDMSDLEGLSAMTAYSFINVDSVASRDVIWEKYQTSSLRMGLYLYDGTLYAEMGNGSNAFGALSSISSYLTAGQDHFIALVFDGSQTGNANRLKLYIDGEYVAFSSFTGTIPATTPSNTGTLYIGAYDASTYPDRNFAGTIDNVIFYNDVRTATEIYNDYINGLKGGGQVGHWKFDKQGARGIGGAFDPANKGTDIVLSNSNLTATINNAGSWRSVKTTTSFSSGIEAYEVTYDEIDANNPFYGFANASASVSTYIVSTTNGIAYRPTGEVWYNNAVVTSSLQTMTTGDQLLCAYSHSDNTFRIWYRAGGTGAYSQIGSGWTNKSSEALYGAVSMRNAQACTIRTSVLGLSDEAYTALGTQYTTNAIDSSELGNDGTLTNATWTGSGYFGYTGDNSITFDGTDDSVDIGDIAELSFERTDKFSFDAWVKSSDASNFQVILAKRDTGANNFRGYELFLNNSGYLSAILCNDNSPANLIYVQSTTTLVADGSWHMVSMTYDGSSSASGVKLYVDSTLQSLTTTNNNLSATIDNSVSFRIGRREDSAIDFNGVIDTVVVYNYERTAAEISAVYTASIPSGVANIIDTTNAFSSDSKILSIRNNAVEQAYMSGDGKLYNSAGEIAAYSDGGTGGSGSAGAGNQYVELNINGTTYKILHDGTV